MPKISIIMPIYNVERYIEKALDSVINQTLKDIELICVDDCSPDRSMDIVQKYATNPMIKIVKQEKNQGQGLARNKGLEIAKGDYVMFLDPDDWLELNACEEAYKQIVKNNDDMVFFDIYCTNPTGAERNKRSTRIEALKSFNSKTSFKLKDVNTEFIKTSEIFYKIYKKSFLEEKNVKFSSDRFGEDGIFTIDAYLNANTVSILDKPLYNYRAGRNYSVTAAASLKKFATYIDTKNRNLNSILSSPENHWLLKSFLPYYVDSILFFFNKFTKENAKEYIKFYKIVKKLFVSLDKKFEMENYLDKKQNEIFKKIITYGPYMIKIVNFKEMLNYVFKCL